MQYADRTGRSLGGSTLQDRFLENLYASFLGRMLIKPLVHPAFSKICGVFLDSPLSAPIIPGFMKSAGICAEDCETPAGGRYRSFNAFFTRRMLPEARPFDVRDHILCSPCDGFASVYPIHKNMRITIKHTQYTLEQLLRDSGLAARYAGGTALLLRLTVSDYHRYAYVDRGRRSSYRRIPGVLHTVNPAAASRRPVYKENSREYSLLRTGSFGTVLMMEIGALMVGKIVNHHKAYTSIDVFRGQEKGYFAFGGSSILLLFQPGTVVIDKDIMRNTALDVETRVRMGEAIGQAMTAIEMNPNEMNPNEMNPNEMNSIK